MCIPQFKSTLLLKMPAIISAYWKKGIDKFLDTNLQFVKNAVFAKHSN